MNLPGPDAKDKMRYELPLLRNTQGQGQDRLKIEKSSPTLEKRVELVRAFLGEIA